jgi:hypothetical protein
MPVARPSFGFDSRGDSGWGLVGAIEAVAAGRAPGSCDPDSAGPQSEVKSFGSPSCAGKAASGLFVEAATSVAAGKSKTVDCGAGIPSCLLGTGSTCAAAAFESTDWPHCLQKRLPGARAAPHCAQERVVGESACCGKAAGAGSAASVDSPTGLPHCLQKRLPGARAAPQCEQE